jgi:hypothetical protein
MPLLLTGRDIIHNIGRKRAVTWRGEGGLRERCLSLQQPPDWLAAHASDRAPCSASWVNRINDHGRQLPRLISGLWELTYYTPTFMAKFYFNGEFILPSRAASRAARSVRQSSRLALSNAPPDAANHPARSMTSR